ncbi:MAG: iron transporter [Rhodospirillales bacterium]|nr:iron transporter [Rhodospirillales bacterium]
MSVKTPKFLAVLALAGLAATVALAKEYPIGKPVTKNGMEVAAVYLQPIEMEPKGMMRPAAESDIHLEADIKATQGNVNGIAEGEWVPYLSITYELTKAGSSDVIKGPMMPMVASDGPHYGDNVKLMGPGKYKLKLVVSAPDANPHNHFGRHTDKETGVAPWFKPFEAEYDFTFAGTGKKGSY